MPCDLRLPHPGRDRSCPPGTSGSRCRADPARTSAAEDAARSRLGVVAVDVGVAKPEAELLVEPVGRDPSVTWWTAWTSTLMRGLYMAGLLPLHRELWEAPSAHSVRAVLQWESVGTNRGCPWMTAAARCPGHIGGTAGEDELGSWLMVTSSWCSRSSSQCSDRLHGRLTQPQGRRLQCSDGDCGPPAAAVREDGRRMAEPEASAPRECGDIDDLTRADVVGRDGIEPPTLRFSAARSTD
jgi:hypothetical protein